MEPARALSSTSSQDLCDLTEEASSFWRGDCRLACPQDSAVRAYPDLSDTESSDKDDRTGEYDARGPGADRRKNLRSHCQVA